jgi:FkbM family methyltransferase
MLKRPLKFIKEKIRSSIFKQSRQAMDSLPHYQGISLYDIGAAGEIEPRWKNFEEQLYYFGFEPDSRSREGLVKKETKCREYTVYPYALGQSTGTSIFYETNKPVLSSFLKPNLELLRIFPESNRWEIYGQAHVPLTSLDELQTERVDFIKIDTQGSELDILRGARSTLSKCIGIEVEVEFIDLYSDQPLFGEIVTFLKDLDFIFIDFINICRWEQIKWDGKKNWHNGLGQCVFGDALFLRKPEYIVLRNSRQEISTYLACLLLYQRFDLIEITIEQIHDDIRESYQLFNLKCGKLRKRFNLSLKIHKYTDIIHSMLGINSRSHLLY